MAARGIHPARLALTPEERATLERWVRRGSTAQALALRARVVLACADRLVECWFSLLQRRALARAEFASTDALDAALRAYIAATNAEPKPFVWTKAADGILASVARFCRRASGSHR
jgi:hypothetical protein